MTFSNDSSSPSLFSLNDNPKENKGMGRNEILLYFLYLPFAEKLYFTFFCTHLLSICVGIK